MDTQMEMNQILLKGEGLALVHLMGTNIQVATLVCTKKLGGARDMLPQENLFEFDAVSCNVNYSMQV